MLLRTPCISRIARTRPHRMQWRRTPARCYSSTASDDPAWFQQLRAEMLQRDFTHLSEHITGPPEHKLTQTLYGHLPQEFCHTPGVKKPVLPVGHHLIWFNPAWPTRELLPDGTDVSQSPGSPWVRRMWAGGSIQLRPDDYYDKWRGLALDTPMAGVERIKDVRLRGQDDSAKIFVTIERSFARLDRLKEGYRAAHGSLGRTSGLLRALKYLEDQVRQDAPWGDAILKEERSLVFMQERTTAELEAIKAGEMAVVKYLDPPGTPHFSHTFTPDRALLFRFSALTFNAHLIHLDRDYARNVEGHRNLLVHGPLSLMLMLKAVGSYVNSHTDGKHVVESIEYRNLAPLYCDEEMRICGLEKKTLQNGSIYDVWIEGPTGRVAVKGIVYTTMRNVAPTPPPNPTPPAKETGAHQNKMPKPATRSVKFTPSRRVVLDGTHPQSVSRQWERTKKPTPEFYRRVTLDKTEPKSATGDPFPNEFEPTELNTTFGLEQAASKTEQSTKRPAPETEQPIQHTATPSADPGHPAGEKPDRPILQENTPQPSFREVAPSSLRAPSRAYRRNRPTRTQTYQFITTPIIRRVDSVTPARSVVSPSSKNIMRRLARRTPTDLAIKPIPLLRKHGARPYIPDPDRIAARHSRFGREGARKMVNPRIRAKSESLEHVERLRGRRAAHYGF